MIRSFFFILLAFFLSGPARAQSPGTLAIHGPSNTPGAAQITKIDQINAPINTVLTAKADASGGVLTNPAITGGTIAGTPISGAPGAFTTFSASGAVSGAGITAILTPYAPLAGTNTWSGAQHFGAQTVDGSAIAFTGGTETGVTHTNDIFSGTLSGSPTWSGNHTFNAAVTFNGLNTVANGHSFNFADASGNNSGFIASGNSLVFRGTTSAGAASTAFTLPLHTDTPTLAFSVPVSHSQPVAIAGTGANFSINAGAIAQSGSALTRAFYSTTSASGTLSSTGYFNQFNLQGDTVAVSGTNFANLVGMTYGYGGAAMTGNRQGLAIAVDQFTTSGNFGVGNNPFYVASVALQNIHANDGGTGSTLATSWGHAYAWNPVLQIYAGGTNFTDGFIAEYDISVAAPVARKLGIVVAQLPTDTVQGTVADAAFKIGGAGGAGWRNGYQVGGDISSAVMDPNGALFSGRMSLNWATHDALAAYGVDVQEYTMSKAAFRSKNFKVDGSGNIQTGTAFISTSSTGTTIDSSGSILSGTPTINTGGTGWTTGDIAADIYDGLYTITASAGAVTAVAVRVKPVYPGLTGQPATLAITGNSQAALGPGPTAVINAAWDATRSATSINASGGPIIMAGLPSSAPATHCALWANSGVVTRTTCP